MVDALLLNRDVSALFLPCPEAMNFREFTFHALELIEDKTTVLLPNYKRRAIQGVCDAHGKRHPASENGQSLADERYFYPILRLLTILS